MVEPKDLQHVLRKHLPPRSEMPLRHAANDVEEDASIWKDLQWQISVK